ncbi:hypothetical protein GJ496_009377 [Pomphorhynchus laevis]|nr:hypothetical protein GJ496_009377 [Pomphorhynchus laevis]
MRLVHERTLIFALIENIRVREQNFVLPVTVVEHQDTQPLFGIPWILAMNFNMPPVVRTPTFFDLSTYINLQHYFILLRCISFPDKGAEGLSLTTLSNRLEDNLVHNVSCRQHSLNTFVLLCDLIVDCSVLRHGNMCNITSEIVFSYGVRIIVRNVDTTGSGFLTALGYSSRQNPNAVKWLIRLLDSHSRVPTTSGNSYFVPFTEYFWKHGLTSPAYLTSYCDETLLSDLILKDDIWLQICVVISPDSQLDVDGHFHGVDCSMRIVSNFAVTFYHW